MILYNTQAPNVRPDGAAVGMVYSKSLPMTINDRGRNQAQAGQALHAPAEARRAFRDLARAEAAEPLERRPGQQGVGRVQIGNLAAVLFGSGFHFPACRCGF